jgi:hypothetical protein
MGAGTASIVSTAVVVTCITFFTIIFGELVPKRIGQLYPEPVARWVSRPMRGLAKGAKPFVWLLAGATATMLKLLRIDANAARSVTEEEISASLEEGVDAGVIEQHEHQMVRNVFHLDDRRLSSLMIPRADIEWLDASFTVQQALQKVADAAALNLVHSWYPGVPQFAGRRGRRDQRGAPAAPGFRPRACSARRPRPPCSCPRRSPAWSCSSSSASAPAGWCSWSTSTAWCRAS